MDWPGIRDDLAATDARGALLAENVSFAVDGELRRRPGLGDRIAEAGILSSEFQHPTLGNYVVLLSSAGALKSVLLSDGTETSLKTGLNTGYRGCFARSNGRLYFVNDFDAMQRIERGDITCGTAGITGPTGAIGTPAESAGNCEIGVHLVRYRYYDSKSGYVSNPSDPLEHTISSSNKTLTFTITDSGGGGDIIRSTDTKVDQIIVEMTLIDGTVYYQAGKVNQTATEIAISISEQSLSLATPAAQYGDYGHEAPPLFSLVAEHRGRLFGWGATVRTGVSVTVSNGSASVSGTGFSTNWAGRLVTFGTETTQYRILSVASSTAMTLSQTYAGALTTTTAKVFSSAPDTLYWSRAGYPESWKPAEWGRRVLQNQADTPSGMASFFGDLYLFGQRCMRVLTYTTDPATGKLDHIPTEMGLWNQRCLVEADGKLFGWGRSGVWVIQGIQPKHISRGIDPTLEDDYDASEYEQFHGVYDPRERVITWFYCNATDTYPKSAFSLDIDSGKWQLRSFRQGIRAATILAQGTNAVQALLSDENGYSWYLTADRFDGVPSSMTDGVLTCGSGSTTTVIQISSPSLPTGSTDLAGVILYHPTTGEEKLISSNTASAITLSSALANAPSASTELYVGSFSSLWRSKWQQLEAGKDKIRPDYLHLSKVPGTSTGKVNVKTYADFSGTAQTYTTVAADTNPDGVTITDGANKAIVDLDGGSGDGVTSVPIPAGWKRSLSVSIDTERPDGTFRILELSLPAEADGE